MGDRILVAYASKCGSTAEVAQAIGQELCAAGAAVDVLSVKDVKDLAPYHAVVLGSALRMGKPLGTAQRFVRQYGATLEAVPCAVFGVGITMNEDTPERRSQMALALQSIAEPTKAVSMGMFGGKVDPATMEPLLRLATSFIKEGDMAPGDHRDWDAIRAWAHEVAPLLKA